MLKNKGINKVVELKNTTEMYNNGEFGVYYLDHHYQTSEVIDKIIDLKFVSENNVIDLIIREYLGTEELEIINSELEKEEQVANVNEIIDIYGLDDFIGLVLEADNLENLLAIFGLKYGTVGYSNWAYYIALKDVNDGMIRDVYEGWNFYSMIISNIDGEVVDSLGNCYIKNETDIIYYLENYFIMENETLANYGIVENENLEYIDIKELQKVREFYTKHYEVIR